MDIKDKPNRAKLKSYFVKNAIPTAGNFADLIDGLINQADDGIAKLPGEPIRLQADVSDTGIKKVINFYKNFADLKPAWALCLNPRVDLAKPETAKPGWSIGDADGNSKLFIDESTGNVGIGTVEPKVTLAVKGTFDVYHDGPSGAHLTVGGHAITLKGLNDPKGSPHLPYIQWRQADDKRAMYLGWGDTNAKSIDLKLENGYGLNISGGKIGIETSTPFGKFDVNGIIRTTSLFNAAKDPDSGMSHGGNLVIKGNAPQIDFIDTEHNDWSIHVNSNKMYFIRQPWNYTDLVLDGGGNVGIGTDSPRTKLEVTGAVMEKLDVIKCLNRGDWSAANHPIMQYFKAKLSGKPVGTYLKAIQDHPSWRGHYWQGWVDAGGKIRVIHNYYNTTHVVT